MKSFPSTLNESQNMYGASKAISYDKVFDIDRLKHGSLNLNKSIPVIQEMLKQQNINISNYNAYPSTTVLGNPEEIVTITESDIANLTEARNNESMRNAIGGTNFSDASIALSKAKGTRASQMKASREKVYYENPLELPSDIIALAKDYDWVYNNRVKGIASVGEKNGDSLKVKITNTAIAPSMFNPMYGISVLGIIRNTPLLNDIEDTEIDPKTTDCSIRTLCALSKMNNSPLGQARYKYADFMYCKDLGKVSNNHLITLRKFAHPVGDHIFEMTSPKFVQSAGDYSFQSEGDIGRLVTWFGTDDNKLEDICKYSYHATWKELTAQIEEQEGNSDDDSTGIIGMIANSFNPVYNEAVGKGQVGTHSIWGWLGSQISEKTVQGIGKNNGLLRNYDNNKVYTPKNTIQSTHIYEGKLEFAQEFTLTFSYQLRAYENINPRSALLDLLGNILEVTYRRGKFWGGSRKTIGPPQDLAPFDKTSRFIDNAWDKLGSIFTSFQNGGYNLNNLLGNLGIKGALDEIMNLASSGSISSLASSLKDYFQGLMSGSGFAEAAKGLLKNALGRPTLYAWQSLLSGDDVGLWHVTIGNPRNPIMVMGNLILTNATVKHMGPLGIDDFPTELKVEITLKHARPRDVTEIGRMYTKGAAAIYHTMAHHDLNDFFGKSSSEYSNGTGEKVNENPQNNNHAGQNITSLEEIKQSSLGTQASVNEAYWNDVKKHAGDRYSQYPDMDSRAVSNPFLETEENIHIARTNNWTDTMFSMSMQEAA